MEFNEKLQQLRRNANLTQEELASRLFVSRTAISKWESGRGYPSIDSLRAISDFFSISLDSLLSSDELFALADADKKQAEQKWRSRFIGITDLFSLLLLALPIFASRVGGTLTGVSHLIGSAIPPYMTIAYLVLIIATALCGVISLALAKNQANAWHQICAPLSLSLGAITVALFALGLQAYATIFALALLAIKTFLIIKRR